MKRIMAAVLLAGCATTQGGFEAILDMDRLQIGKGNQGVWLETKDGQHLLVSYELIPEYFRFVEKRVVVVGETYQPDPYTQHIMAPHIRITSIELAPGETAYDPEPKSLPLPPLAKARAELEPRIGRWIEVQGNLRHAEKHTDDDWCDATIALTDGTRITAQMYLTDMESRWQPLVGQQVTVLGKLARAVDAFVFRGPPAICAGSVRGCGMR